MAIGEDAASVLEQFTQDAANLPAEIAHLLEEIQAKDKFLQECRNVISARDGSIQKFIKANGGLVVNPKEDTYSKVISQNYDRAQILQEEKLGLSEKAGVLLDRQIKRLDIKIRDLQHEGAMSSDPPLPSLLHDSPANLVAPASTPNTGISTPLNPLSVNAGPSTTIANSGLAQLARPQPGSQHNGSSSAVSGIQPLHPLLGSSHLVNSAPTTPVSGINLHPRQRESSAGPLNDAKRRRHNNQPGSLLATSTTIRQASNGPPTPKAGTPASARGGSAGPRAGIKKSKKIAPHQIRKGPKGETPKKSVRKLHGGLKASQSDEESVLSESNETDENAPQIPTAAVVGDEDAEEIADEDEAGDDTTKYCTCQSVSYGDMVACDNDDCPYEWFHWTCVGLTKEPNGKWYCEECTKRLRLA